MDVVDKGRTSQVGVPGEETGHWEESGKDLSGKKNPPEEAPGIGHMTQSVDGEVLPYSRQNQ